MRSMYSGFSLLGSRSTPWLGARGARRAARRPPRGIVYPLLLASILVIGVATAGVAELWTTQIKREKEEELLFRLSEIRRGIIRFRADKNRLPRSSRICSKTGLSCRPGGTCAACTPTP